VEIISVSRLLRSLKILCSLMADGRRPSIPRTGSSSTRLGTERHSNGQKPADYVYFERTTSSFSDEAVPRAKTAQLRLEHYYKIAVDSAIDRNTRRGILKSVNHR
jgi:hypothetical protein